MRHRGANLELITDLNDLTLGAKRVYRHRDKDGKVHPGHEMLEPAWNRKLPESYERNGLTRVPIGCVLGAGYFFHKKWFQHILGLRGLLPISAFLYNKLFYMHVVDMPPAVRRKLFRALPDTPYRREAVGLFRDQRRPTREFLRLLRGRYVRSFLDYCERFGIALPS